MKKSKTNPMTRPYILMNDRVYKKIRANRAQDIYVAQDMTDRKLYTFSYAVVKDNHEILYMTPEVAEILGVSMRSLRDMIRNGFIPKPRKPSRNVGTHSYAESLKAKGVTKGAGVGLKNPGRVTHLFTKQDIYNAREVYAGRVRGLKFEVPTKKELDAILEQDVVLYVKTKDGFVPTWKAAKF